MNPLHLRAAGTSLVISVSGDEAEIVHWGPDLGLRSA
jgi:alpha-galactosidase